MRNPFQKAQFFGATEGRDVTEGRDATEGRDVTEGRDATDVMDGRCATERRDALEGRPQPGPALPTLMSSVILSARQQR